MNPYAPPEAPVSGNSRDGKTVYLCLIAGAIVIATAYAGVEFYRAALH